MSREVHVRFCERLEVKFLRPTHPYIKVAGRWCYVYRAIDSSGALVDVLFREQRDMKAARAFFRSAQAATGTMPKRVTTDGHDSYPRAIRTELRPDVRHRTSR
jgi:putative transposase